MQASAYSPVTQTFSYTGGEQTFTVPTGVTQIHVIAIGGTGAPGGATPGGAARVSTDLLVSPGTTLYVEVGGNAATGIMRAFNGGGMSGGIGAGGGGGASDIQTCSINDACDPHTSGLVVAGGSGGGGGNGGGTGGPGRRRREGEEQRQPCGHAGGNESSRRRRARFPDHGRAGGAPTTFGGMHRQREPVRNRRNRGRAFGGCWRCRLLQRRPRRRRRRRLLRRRRGGGGGVISNCGGPTAAGGGGGGAGASFISGADPAQINLATTIDPTGVPKIAIIYTPTDTTAPAIAIDAPADGASTRRTRP